MSKKRNLLLILSLAVAVAPAEAAFLDSINWNSFKNSWFGKSFLTVLSAIGIYTVYNKYFSPYYKPQTTVPKTPPKTNLPSEPTKNPLKEEPQKVPQAPAQPLVKTHEQQQIVSAASLSTGLLSSKIGRKYFDFAEWYGDSSKIAKRKKVS